jgi:hypothetical protein
MRVVLFCIMETMMADGAVRVVVELEAQEFEREVGWL